MCAPERDSSLALPFPFLTLSCDSRKSYDFSICLPGMPLLENCVLDVPTQETRTHNCPLACHSPNLQLCEGLVNVVDIVTQNPRALLP